MRRHQRADGFRRRLDFRAIGVGEEEAGAREVAFRLGARVVRRHQPGDARAFGRDRRGRFERRFARAFRAAAIAGAENERGGERREKSEVRAHEGHPLEGRSRSSVRGSTGKAARVG